jgi:hypothetical protein
MFQTFINCATHTGLLRGERVCIFYNNATSTKLKRYPWRGYIIVDKIINIEGTTSERLHYIFTGQD